MRKTRNFLRKRLGREAKSSSAGGQSTRYLVVKDTVAVQNYFFLQGLMRRASESGVNRVDAGAERLVVSLTSIEPRLYELAPTIESLLRQTIKPDAIVLWLDQDSCSTERLPVALRRQMERGLSVRFCEDIGPHTKLVPALRAFPEAAIITVDDDVLYPPYLVERLTRAYEADKTRIYCTRARRIALLREVGLAYGTDWPNLHTAAAGLTVLPLGVGGVLYPPGVFGDEEVFNLARQRQLAPKADDIWFKAMSLRQGVVCQKVHFRKEHFPMTPFSQEVELGKYNVLEGGNNIQIRDTFDHYGLWEVLRPEVSDL